MTLKAPSDLKQAHAKLSTALIWWSPRKEGEMRVKVKVPLPFQIPAPPQAVGHCRVPTTALFPSRINSDAVRAVRRAAPSPCCRCLRAAPPRSSGVPLLAGLSSRRPATAAPGYSPPGARIRRVARPGRGRAPGLTPLPAPLRPPP